MRFKLGLLAGCSALLTASLIVAAAAKGREYREFLAAAPGRAQEGVLARRESLVQGFGVLLSRVRNRKSALLRERLVSASNRAFSSSPETERELRHLRRLAARGLLDRESWVRFDPAADGVRASAGAGGVALGRRSLDVPPLDAARVFWEETQRVYDLEARAALDSRLGRASAASMPPAYEGELRARRAGCAFLEAGLRAGLEHAASGADGAPCGDDPGWIACLPDAAERIVAAPSEGRDGLEWDCLELERASRGNPSSMDGFESRWTVPECLREARRAVSAPGWRGSKQRCPFASDGGEASAPKNQ